MDNGQRGNGIIATIRGAAEPGAANRSCITPHRCLKTRSSLYRLIDEAADNHAPIRISGKRNSAVLVGGDDWSAIQETLYLAAIPAAKNWWGILKVRIRAESISGTALSTRSWKTNGSSKSFVFGRNKPSLSADQARFSQIRQLGASPGRTKLSLRLDRFCIPECFERKRRSLPDRCNGFPVY